MATDLDILRHKEWLGLLQPVGLVVSPPALIKAQAIIDRGRLVNLQERLVSCLRHDVSTALRDRAQIDNFPLFTEKVLGWREQDLVGAPGQEALPSELSVVLPSYGETLQPTYAVRDPDTTEWILLVQELAPEVEFDQDDPATIGGQGWKATIQAKFERLLRETGVYAGLLTNGTSIRLVYAPKGESSGHLTFPVQAMTEVPGRLILGALDLLLGEDRLFNVPENQRLTRLLEDSRNYQAEVSTKLSGQVLDALWELLRGFQAADAAVNGRILRELAEIEPQHIYGGLIATLMRLVFLLYAEDEGLMPDDEVYQRSYAVSGLYEKLREDAGNYPDTIDQRYGAWAALLSLFRLVYDGGGPNEEYLPARRGQLFDPDEYPFLEGRPLGSEFATFGRIEAPRISDGVVYRMLDKLLVLDGERLSYRSLDVEQIGSVYEAIMGFEVTVARGRSIAVRPKDVVVDVDQILAAKPADRTTMLKTAECELKGAALKELKEAKTVEAIVAAIGRRVSPRTPNLLAAGSLFLQPGEERRRTGTHYTPRKLTQPIVERTLEPVLWGLGEHPTPQQLLDLKMCDLAMGSAAFLVEACRQLADKLVEAWNYYGKPADLPENVEDVIVARRRVAQACLYGVDKNPFAVVLARLSLWLVTLAKDLPFTFLDHALKCGDSLVGVRQPQLSRFMSASDLSESALIGMLQENAQKTKFYRELIAFANESQDEQNQENLEKADSESYESRVLNDVIVAAFFESKRSNADDEKDTKLMSDVALAAYIMTFSKSKRDAKKILKEFATRINLWRSGVIDRSEIELLASIPRKFEKAISPIHWETEFPEVFSRENPGFDFIAGNPPFAGKNTLINAHPEGYLAWLQEIHPEAHGNSDLIAHFFRRSFDLLRHGGTFGLIATNTISQGDTRSTGLRYICQNEGTIYYAQKRLKWPGLAAVVVSVVNIFKGKYQYIKTLDGQTVEEITAFLFHKGGHENPAVLLANANKSFQGSIVLGMGFTFDDTKADLTSIATMNQLIEKDPRNAERIFPYIGGDEINNNPTHSHHRYVINFGDMSEDEARKYPDLMAIVEEKVKPQRLLDKREIYRRKWWQFCEKRVALYKAIENLDRVLVTNAQAAEHHTFVFYTPKVVFANSLNVFPFQTYSSFSVLQSRIHEIWARFFSSSLEDRLRYNPSDCFETFPFPENWETNSFLEFAGKTYYESRAILIVQKNQGLTDTYDRFHNRDETNPDILKLRELHAQIDRAVLDAYGWTDIPTDYEFLLDYEDEDEEGSSKRKKPWRYRWNEAIHDEVLARLLKLNQDRAEAEIRGRTPAQKSPAKTRKKAKKPTGDYETLPLFATEEDT
ncbi:MULTISPECIES: Eco57I restriction-modification methylase domain-containing protein [Leptolyngbya]|uniref:Eco57I restriction-modification methylase domain-containing protein n=1 Tax=Leptolyngbya TaxID=47251 RepID=UPI0016829921|nr:DNA methyltransferase [Leptolyngbya sp. FACHB-1624]MBD1858010.1 N-6 DNA methylase [Leptolyngbya sp. FACHB-1624]